MQSCPFLLGRDEGGLGEQTTFLPLLLTILLDLEGHLGSKLIPLVVVLNRD